MKESRDEMKWSEGREQMGLPVSATLGDRLRIELHRRNKLPPLTKPRGGSSLPFE